MLDGLYLVALFSTMLQAVWKKITSIIHVCIKFLMQHQFVCRCEFAYNNVGLFLKKKRKFSTLFWMYYICFQAFGEKLCYKGCVVLCKVSFELTCVQFVIMHVQRWRDVTTIWPMVGTCILKIDTQSHRWRDQISETLMKLFLDRF